MKSKLLSIALAMAYGFSCHALAFSPKKIGHTKPDSSHTIVFYVDQDGEEVWANFLGGKNDTYHGLSIIGFEGKEVTDKSVLEDIMEELRESKAKGFAYLAPGEHSEPVIRLTRQNSDCVKYKEKVKNN